KTQGTWVMIEFTITPLKFRKSAINFLVLGVITIGTLAAHGSVCAQENAKQERFVIDFRKPISTYPQLTTFGPYPEKVLKTEPEGLRMTVEAGRQETGHVGVEAQVRLQGDFTIVAGYEFISCGEPVHQYGSGIVFRVNFDSPPGHMVNIARKKTA